MVDLGNDEELADKIRFVILEELPGDDRDAKLAFVKNTLKAFCNFYHFSVGGLSVAVIAPIKELIKKLEVMQKEWEESDAKRLVFSVVDDRSL
jgi:hypothetical protein